MAKKTTTKRAARVTAAYGAMVDVTGLVHGPQRLSAYGTVKAVRGWTFKGEKEVYPRAGEYERGDGTTFRIAFVSDSLGEVQRWADGYTACKRLLLAALIPGK